MEQSNRLYYGPKNLNPTDNPLSRQILERKQCIRKPKNSSEEK